MIELENVGKSYRSGRGKIRALSDISFRLEAGKSLTLIGKSGSGKTTLLNCIGGIEALEIGAIRCFGIPVHHLNPKALSRFQRRDLGVVFQFGNLLSYLTIYENISFPLLLNGRSSRTIRRDVEGILERVGLSGYGQALPFELSGGEVQRVAVARAIVHSPRLLLADEPTASLDSATGLALIELMLSLGKERGCTLIIATHDPQLMALSEESIELRDGQIVGRKDALGN
jgi:ABC-type lipoprotein export system ATPase subunit